MQPDDDRTRTHVTLVAGAMGEVQLAEDTGLLGSDQGVVNTAEEI